jgi:hypothetical protein
MALYEVLEDSYINDKFVLAGSIIEYTPPKAARKPPANASDDEKAKPEYQDTVIGRNLKPAAKNAEQNEIAAETVSRTVG